MNEYFVKTNIPLVSVDLPDGEFRLLLLLMIRGYGKGVCSERKYKLANKLHTTTRTIERRLKTLKEEGYIQIKKRKNQNNSGDNASYFVLTEKTKQLFR